eukprot:3763382-Pyramimonas_sp.AAC.1
MTLEMRLPTSCSPPAFPRPPPRRARARARTRNAQSTQTNSSDRRLNNSSRRSGMALLGASLQATRPPLSLLAHAS